MKVQEGKTYLTVPHERGELTFEYPAFQGTYLQVAEKIDKAGAKRPGSAETASLVYDSWKNPKEKYSSEIIKILKNNWILEFTGNLYLPKSNEEINNGVILEYNPKITNGKLIMNKNSLIKRLKENDHLVKFVPFGYKINEQNLIEFQKNPYITARYGKEGAEKITEVASKHKSEPYLYSFNFVNEEKIRMSALDNDWNFANRLDVYGNYWYDGDLGHAFGYVKKKSKCKII
ncbi:MAG: hypothetical protein AABX44_00645 [Nanoarchaeota archaeon]